MGLVGNLRAKAATYRLSEEAVFAAVAREIEAGERRDGLWAKALSESGMDETAAKARYISLRATALKDELALMEARLNNAPVDARVERKLVELKSAPATPPSGPQSTAAQWRDQKRRGRNRWLAFCALNGIGWGVFFALPIGEPFWYGPLLFMATAAIPFWAVGLAIDFFKKGPR